MLINPDAFSNGQIDSKLWLCRELENIGWESKLTHIYGGWCGVLGFLLLSREQFKVNRIESYDLDPACESVADMINENWVFKEWKFKAHTADCNNIKSGNPDLIINTSSEHFESIDWFNNIPTGTRVIIQGNNMPHDDHIIHSTTLDSFVKQYPLSQIVYSGSLNFTYPDWQFTRYMVIGIK
jgi:hypothetical protein